MIPPDYKITTGILLQGALIFACIDSIYIPLLVWRIKPVIFRRIRWVLVGVTAVYWCALWVWVLKTFWDPVYHYVFPAWARGIIPPAYGTLFAGVCLLFWWLALRLRGNPVLTFCLLGGLWGIITHLMAIALGIVSKPPVLQGAAPQAAIIIAFFEFMFYWCLILSVAALLYHIWLKARPGPA